MMSMKNKLSCLRNADNLTATDSGTEVQDSNGFLKCFSHIADPDHKEAKIFVS